MSLFNPLNAFWGISLSLPDTKLNDSNCGLSGSKQSSCNSWILDWEICKCLITVCSGKKSFGRRTSVLSGSYTLRLWIGPRMISSTDLRESTVAAGHSRNMPFSKLKQWQDGLAAKLGHFVWSAMACERTKLASSIRVAPYCAIMKTRCAPCRG